MDTKETLVKLKEQLAYRALEEFSAGSPEAHRMVQVIVRSIEDVIAAAEE